jgi:transcriptional regulator with XRE-family HTH domain
MAQNEPLRWRRTCIRFWREYRDYTLEQAAEALERYHITTTHASLGRIERGRQMPTIEMIEALAVLYRTDINRLLNERPPGHLDIAPHKAIRGHRAVAIQK